ncbi:MAG: molybdenum cofactor guanylyltransferase [Proteobacteria bacterium]|nr:molybdenum cofactor guanylyltransferase [Pseudomonadota bacterium]
MNISCAILAGGKSLRMGRDKATLPVGTKLLINMVHDEAKKVFKEIIVISNHHERITGIDAPIFKDILPLQSPIVGIASALLYADTPYVFVLPCDAPFVSEESIEYMIDKAHGEDLIIPRSKGGYEPLYAIYSRSCIPHLFKLIAQNNLKVRGLFPFISVKVLEEHPYFINNGYSVFTNINAINDLAIIQNQEGTGNKIFPQTNGKKSTGTGNGTQEEKPSMTSHGH